MHIDYGKRLKRQQLSMTDAVTSVAREAPFHDGVAKLRASQPRFVFDKPDFPA
jgi:hypothetical protein